MSKPFEDVSTFNFEELEGKDVRIRIGVDKGSEDGDTIVIIGHDMKENKMYVLNVIRQGDK